MYYRRFHDLPSPPNIHIEKDYFPPYEYNVMTEQLDAIVESSHKKKEDIFPPKAIVEQREIVTGLSFSWNKLD